MKYFGKITQVGYIYNEIHSIEKNEISHHTVLKWEPMITCSVLNPAEMTEM